MKDKYFEINFKKSIKTPFFTVYHKCVMKLRFEFSSEKGAINFTSFCKQTNTFEFWIE